MRILLIGNSVLSMEVLQASLESHGLDASDIVACTSETLGVTLSTQCAVDTVILHPGKASLAAKIKSMSPDICALLISHPDDYILLDAGLDNWIDDYITSPFSSAELGVRLRRLMGRDGHSDDITIVSSKVYSAADETTEDHHQVSEFVPRINRHKKAGKSPGFLIKIFLGSLLGLVVLLV